MSTKPQHAPAGAVLGLGGGCWAPLLLLMYFSHMQVWEQTAGLQPERAQAPSHFGTEHGPQQWPSPGQALADQVLFEAKPSWQHTALTVGTCHSPGFQRGLLDSPALDRQGILSWDHCSHAEQRRSGWK